MTNASFQTLQQGQLPQHIVQLAMTSQLGELRHIYQPRFTNPLVVLGIMLAVTILDGAVMLGIILVTGYLFYILLLIPIVVIIWGIAALPHTGTRVYLFAYGLMYRKGSQVQAMRWEQIQSVLHKIIPSRRSVSHAYTLQLNNDQQFKLPAALREISDLGTRIEDEVTRMQLPRALEMFRAGGPLTFGRLTIDQRGISNGKDLVTWSHIGSIGIQKQYVVAEQQGVVTPLSLKTEDVPNLALLQQVVNHHTRR